MASMAYAGIGSRRTPPAIIARMAAAAGRLARMGFTLRSGGADGADMAFERGADEHKEIFLPWRGFNNNPSPLDSPSIEAAEIAASIHPAWNSLPQAAKKLMARNSHQILGADLRTPSDFVVCWTPCGAENEKTTTSSGLSVSIAVSNGLKPSLQTSRIRCA